VQIALAPNRQLAARPRPDRVEVSAAGLVLTLGALAGDAIALNWLGLFEQPFGCG